MYCYALVKVIEGFSCSVPRGRTWNKKDLRVAAQRTEVVTKNATAFASSSCA